jgi:hypothetical protein
MDSPFQRQDKKHNEPLSGGSERHHLVVKSAIAITFGAKRIGEFEIELDPYHNKMRIMTLV